MKAISLHEPWASLIKVGAKTIETRGWKTHYRGPLLICASKRRVISEIIHLLSWADIGRALKPLAPPWPESGRKSSGVTWQDLNYGNAVAIVELVDCRPMHSVTIGEMYPQRFFGDFTPGRYAWFLENIIPVDPFPVTGRQGFFNVDYVERPFK